MAGNKQKIYDASGRGMFLAVSLPDASYQSFFTASV